MQKSRGNRNLKRSLCRHGEEVTILRSNGGKYDKSTMRWTSMGRTEIKVNMSISKQTPSGGIKAETLFDADGKRKEEILKFYTDRFIKYDDNYMEQADIIVWDNKHFIVAFLDVRRGGDCGSFYIGFMKTYKGERVEK